MRAVCLALALTLAAPAALAGESPFLDALAARGPQKLNVAEGLFPEPNARAEALVENGELVIRIGVPGEPASEFRYDGKGFDRNEVTSGREDYLDLRALCRGGGTDPAYYEVHCYSRGDMMSRALRPPHTIWKLWLKPDGLRVVREKRGQHTTLTPVDPMRMAGARLAPGLEANLGNALSQLAAHQDGYLFGGASGGGEWYGSDLWVRQVRGLDFVLERKVSPDRGGRSDEVPAIWSFDYQGPGPKGASILTWHMFRIRKGANSADFWCVGRPAELGVDIGCYRGGKPSDVRGKPDVAFKLTPYPEWRIDVETGSDNGFSSVGSTRLETLPFP